ncbi:MAG: peptide chain release factor N(5)-glutamine methyltransferase [Bacilli bacterium]
MAISKGSLLIVTYHEWITIIRQHPSDEANLWFLLQELSGQTRSQILLKRQESIPSKLLVSLEDTMKRVIVDHYPPQYLVGHTYFYGRQFIVNPAVLIPRFDTEVVVDVTLSFLPMFKKPRVLDLGTGSGAIAITLQCEYPSACVVASDISKDALEVAIQNAANLHANIQWIQSDGWTHITGPFDMIVSNPPYIDPAEDVMEMVDRYEPHLALYSVEAGFYHDRLIIESATSYLQKDGVLILEIHCDHREQLLQMASVYFKDITFQKDHAGLYRVMIARRPL